MKKGILFLIVMAACGGTEPAQEKDPAALRSLGASPSESNNASATSGDVTIATGDTTATADSASTSDSSSGASSASETTVEVTNDLDITVVVETDGDDTAEPSAPVACDDNEDCSDGDACNGPERCVAGACLPANYALDCDDGIACTDDWCDPRSGCRWDVIETFCAETEYCDGWGVPGDSGCRQDPWDYRCQNGVDEDGNGATDCADPACAEQATCVARTDHDGDEFSFADGDCDDGNPDVHPGASEKDAAYRCDGFDNNCDGTADELCAYCSVIERRLADNDGDGYGDPTTYIEVSPCDPWLPRLVNWIVGNDDCDDTRADVHPGAPEVCDGGVDNDCNAASVESCATTTTPDVAVTCRLTGDTPEDGIAIAGTTVEVAKAYCKATGATVHLRSITLCSTGTNNDAIDTVVLRSRWGSGYEDYRFGSLDAVGCYTVWGSPIFPVFDRESIPPEFDVSVTLREIGSGASSGGEIRFVLAGAEFVRHDTGESFVIEGDWESATQVVRATRPSVAVSASSPSGVLSGGHNEVLRFHVCNDGADELSISQAAFDFAPTGSGWDTAGALRNVMLYRIEDPATDLVAVPTYVVDWSDGGVVQAVHMTLSTPTVPGYECSEYGLRLDTTGAENGTLTVSLTNLVWNDGYADDALDGTGVPGLPAIGSTLRTP